MRDLDLIKGLSTSYILAKLLKPGSVVPPAEVISESPPGEITLRVRLQLFGSEGE
jgi:hypothetical protein